MLFDYVGSGMSFTRIIDVDVAKTDTFIERMNIVLDAFNEKHKYIKHSLLYNAFAEPKFPDFFKNYHNELYADSGGLQVVTRGAEITDEIRQKIYETQSKADYAFCFDKIPVISEGSVGRVIINQKRYVLEDEFFSSGQQTGAYIKEQIEKMKELNAKTKIFMIIQGQNADDYVDFANGVLNALPKEYIDSLEGIALAGASAGEGIKFDISRNLAVAKLEIDERLKKRIHLLGAGVIRKVVLSHYILNKFIDNPYISFDSSTHTRLSTNGVFYDRGDIFKKTSKKLSLPKLSKGSVDNHSHKHYELAKNLENMFNELDIDMVSLGYKDFNDLYKWVKINEAYTKTSFIEENDNLDDLIKYIFIDFLRYIGSVFNFGNDLGNIITNHREIEFLSTIKKTKHLSLLKELKTIEDFEYFLKEFGSELVDNEFQRIKSPDDIKPRVSLF